MSRDWSYVGDAARLREAAEKALIALELDAYGEPPWHGRSEAIDALRAALAEPQATHSDECYQWHHACAVAEVKRLRAALVKPEEAAWPLDRCPKCGGPADNGHDREMPPTPYACSKCQARLRVCVYPQCVSTTRTTCDAWASGACEERV